MYLAVTLVLLIAYFANVLLGSFGGGVILGDKAEMLLLLAVSVSFVATILRAERVQKSKSGKRNQNPDVPSP